MHTGRVAACAYKWWPEREKHTHPPTHKRTVMLAVNHSDIYIYIHIQIYIYTSSCIP